MYIIIHLNLLATVIYVLHDYIGQKVCLLIYMPTIKVISLLTTAKHANNYYICTFKVHPLCWLFQVKLFTSQNNQRIIFVILKFDGIEEWIKVIVMQHAREKHQVLSSKSAFSASWLSHMQATVYLTNATAELKSLTILPSTSS